MPVRSWGAGPRGPAPQLRSGSAGLELLEPAVGSQERELVELVELCLEEGRPEAVGVRGQVAARAPGLDLKENKHMLNMKKQMKIPYLHKEK